MRTHLFVGFFFAAAFLRPEAQAAAVIPGPPSATVFTQVASGSTTQSQFTVGTNTLSIGGMSATAIANFLPSPNETAVASVTGVGSASAFEIIQYYFEATGPSGVSVPIILTASGGVTTPLASANTAELQLIPPTGGVQLLVSACAPAPPPGNFCAANGLTPQPSFSVAAPETITSNAVYSITMDLQIDANTFVIPGGGADSQSGFIDPVVTIDPSFPLAGEFTLEFSPGVGNTPGAPIPEPAAWQILLAEFGGVLTASRMRRPVLRRGDSGLFPRNGAATRIGAIPAARACRSPN